MPCCACPAAGPGSLIGLSPSLPATRPSTIDDKKRNRVQRSLMTDIETRNCREGDAGFMSRLEGGSGILGRVRSRGAGYYPWIGRSAGMVFLPNQFPIPEISSQERACDSIGVEIRDMFASLVLLASDPSRDVIPWLV